ncbi:uncharacterized protein LOC119720342 isoform X4 [Patiria miniata]|uniref:Zinc finger PHD-type domain-containing protein n=1 Tax=Patiria miniata TaxID=46514 RepID=A0A913Z4J7_PATMI|nr:uncharacterized protein LOC119720342 isoform X4 [Patiria miniata]XP_038045921.1 uncharacterized protein LOC119720342 isoform X4 [Patiria miniata]XP_038045922.1 uncharacterized protein LOC119720342 isoform X4 [Patiria miniata]
MTSSGNKNTPECLMCKSPVENTDNSWRRYSLRLSGPSLEQFEGQDGFLCSSCKSKHLQQTASQTQIGQAKKRPSFSFHSTQKARKKLKHSVPLVSSSHSKEKTSRKRFSNNRKLAQYVAKTVSESRYVQAIKAILCHSKYSREAFCTVASKAVQLEMSRCALKILHRSLNAKNIATFKWGKVVEEATSHMPILVNVLQGALYRHQARKATICMPDQRLGFILSLILYSHKQKYNFIQSCVSLKLKRHGCSNSLFDSLHALGVCLNRTLKLSPKDMVRTDYTEKQKQWQLTLSQQLKSIATSVADGETQGTSPCSEEQAAPLNETHLPVNDLDDDKGSSDMSVSVDDNSDSDPLSSAVAESALAVANVDDLASTSSKPKVKHMHPALLNSLRLKYLDPGYIIVCDSVLVELASPRSGYKLQASTFAVRNRVGYDHSLDYTVKRAEEIPLSCFLPSSDDWEGLKQRMCQILERILKDHLPFLKEVECSVSETHQHSDALSERSQIASLGVIDKNPYSTSGSVRIVESLHQFVPSYGDETLYPIVCFGDGLSVVKMIDAKCAKASGVSAADRLEGLVQCPQDFHRRQVLLQDTMDRFFEEDSTKETGTLFQIKEDFSHRFVKQKVAENFNDVENLLNFCTHALGTMLALKLGKLDGTTKTPADFPTSGGASQKRTWLTEFTEEMVDFLWPTLPSDCSLKNVCKQNKTQVCLDKKDFGDILDDMVKDTNGCKCGESSGEGMIRCFNGKCGAWFHYSCANVDGPVEGDWWCSAECQASKSYIYCTCHGKTGKEGNMVQCEMQSHCTSNEWYHAECIRGAKDLPDEWYCSPACKRLGRNQSKSDGVQEYSKALLYEGLCHLAFRDAVREGDGPAILSHWRINTLQFWNSKHLKYFILAHNMLAGVNGFYPARVAHDMTWNRVANLTGQADGNIGLDLVKEIPTDEYWEMVSRTQDGHPEKGEQQDKLRDEFFRNLEGIFLQSHTYEATQAAQEQLKFDHDVKYFTSAYMHDGLFDFVPGRHHKSFPFFKHTVDVNCPELMGKKLLLLSQCMDSWRGVTKS